MKAIFPLKSQKKSLPILDYTLYRDGIFHATDCDMDIACEFPVPGLPDGTLLPRAWLKIAYDSGKGRLSSADGKVNGLAIPTGPSADNMPQAKAFAGTASTSIALGDLKGVGLAMAKQDIRYYLNGMWIDFAGARIAACDGHRIHTVGGLVVQGDTAGASAIIPRAAIELVIKCAGKGGVIPIAYDGVARLVQFRVGKAAITTKVVDGTFPDIDRVIPRAQDRDKGKIVIERDRGIADIKMLNALTKQAGESAIAGTRFSDRRLSKGDTVRECDSLSVIGGIDISINAQYMADAVSFVDREFCEFGVADGNNSVLAIYGQKTALVMPTRF